jgi:hypothetical protein
MGIRIDGSIFGTDIAVRERHCRGCGALIAAGSRCVAVDKPKTLGPRVVSERFSLCLGCGRGEIGRRYNAQRVATEEALARLAFEVGELLKAVI